MLFPNKFPVTITATHNRWLVSGRVGQNWCIKMEEDGYDTKLKGSQVVHGMYGSVQGRVLTGIKQLSYQLFSAELVQGS